MKSRFRWSALLSAAALLGLLTLLVKNVTAGPANLARPADVKKAARELVSPAGEDERLPLAAAGYVAGNGIVEPADREIKVAGHVPGRIAAVHVKEGDAVRIGAVLIELESGEERAALEAAKADLAVADATLTRVARGLRKEDVEAVIAESAAAGARAELSAAVLARTRRLAAEGASTPDELDRARLQAEADARTFKAADARRLAAVRGGRSEDVLVAQAQVRAARARRDQSRAALERLAVRAPIDGTILQVKCRVGEYYNPASANAASADALVTMGDTRTLRVRIDVDERDVARVKLGARGYATLSALPGRRLAGKVVEIGRRMGRKNVRTDDPVERLDVKILEVILQLDDSSGLVPGIRVTAYVQGAS